MTTEGDAGMTTWGGAGYPRTAEGGRHGFCRRTRARRLPPRVPRLARSQSERGPQGRGRARPAHLSGPRDPRKAHRLAEEDARGRLGRDLLAKGVWRARRQFHAAGDLGRGILPRPRPDPAVPERPQPPWPDAYPLGQRGAENPASAEDPQRRRDLVPGLFRTGRWLGS